MADANDGGVTLWRAPNGTLHAFPVEGGVEGVWRPRADDDARPMVTGGAFVKFDRPAPADEGRAAIEREMAETMRVNAPADDEVTEFLRRAVPGTTREEAMKELGIAPDAGAAERAVVEAARALLDGTRRDGCLYCVCGRLMTGNVAHQANCAWNRLDAALRGTKGA